MGAGIAELGCLSGARTLLHDPVPDALDRGLERIRAQLERGVQRGRLSDSQAAAARDRLRAAPALEDLAACELVIEAAPERLELKRELFARLSDGIVADECVLASNPRRSGRRHRRRGPSIPSVSSVSLLRPTSGHAPARGGRR